jgi:hypothetical protein
MTHKRVDVTELNSFVEFDAPFRVMPDGSVDNSLPNVYAPSVYGYGDADGQVTERETIDGREDWEFVDGFSGQYGYSGPVMHPSEFLGGGMARYVLETPGIYCVVGVYDMNDDDGDTALYGWALVTIPDA